MNGSERRKIKGDTKAPDLLPDGWERFERAVDVALHTPPMPQLTKPKKPKRKPKKEKPAD